MAPVAPVVAEVAEVAVQDPQQIGEPIVPADQLQLGGALADHRIQDGYLDRIREQLHTDAAAVGSQAVGVVDHGNQMVAGERGSHRWGSGAEWVGERSRSGVLEGRGRYRYADGSRFDGLWAAGRRTGVYCSS